MGIVEAVVFGEVPVSVAAGGQHRGDYFQFVQSCREIDITGMKDEVNTLKGLFYVWWQGLDVPGNVGIGNKPDAYGLTLCAGSFNVIPVFGVTWTHASISF